MDATSDAHDLLRRVLRNSVICDHMAHYLIFGDLKALRQVSREFCRMVQATWKFVEKAVLVVSAYSVNKGVELSPLMAEFMWRSVRIDVASGVKVVNGVLCAIKSAETVTVVSSKADLGRINVKCILGRVLGAAVTMRRLVVDLCVLRTDVSDVFAMEDVITNVGKLRRLEIRRWDVPHESFSSCVEEILDLKVDVHIYEELRLHKSEVLWRERAVLGTLVRNVKALAEVPLTLEAFALKAYFMFRHDKVELELQRLIPRVLRGSLKTLEELDLHFYVWGADEWVTLEFPRLKRFSVTKDGKMRVYAIPSSNLAEFLSMQTSLEELTLGVAYEYERWSVAAKLSSKLKRLRIVNVYEKRESEWEFLKGMEALEDFAFKSPLRDDWKVLPPGIGPRLLKLLPKNQLRSLAFEGTGSFYDCFHEGFWKTGTRFGKFPQQVKEEWLGGFRCVRRLSFVRCHDAVDDALMGFILREFCQLEELEVTHCFHLSDASISGSDGTSPGLQNLKELRKLGILKCPGVTPESLLEAGSLPLLTTLEYLPMSPVGIDFVVRLVEQNPRLTRLVMLLETPSAALEVRRELWEKGRYIEKLGGWETLQEVWTEMVYEGSWISNVPEFHEIFGYKSNVCWSRIPASRRVDPLVVVPEERLEFPIPIENSGNDRLGRFPLDGVTYGTSLEDQEALQLTTSRNVHDLGALASVRRFDYRLCRGTLLFTSPIIKRLNLPRR